VSILNKIIPVNRDVLIVEDSKAISMLLDSFLKKLNYQKIHVAHSGKEAIKTFQDLTKAGTVPLVMLDYGLPDMTGTEIMTKLLNTKPETKIIVVTAESQTDEKIKDVLRNGAYLFIQKPIRFENLKNALEIAEEEEEILDNSIDMGTFQQINSLLRSSTKVSIARIAEYTMLNTKKIQSYLENLESHGKAKRLGSYKEISCNSCGSVKLGKNFKCPSCSSPNFIQDTLIEHFSCGNVSVQDSYKNENCPKCHKAIKIIGVDHKLVKNYYICQYCHDKFAEPFLEHQCMRCNNKIDLEQAKWVVSESYTSVINQ
jgi:response regulator of citrate/malate metabolism